MLRGNAGNGGGGSGGRGGNNGGTASGKMRIRAFPMTMDENYVQKIWVMLRNAITEIQKKNNSGLSFEELYRNAYTMVLHKHGDRLYNGLREVVSEHLATKVRDDVQASVIAGDFLATLNNAWTDHTTSMVMIRDILMYMDRVYVQQQNVENVYSLGMILFRDEVIRYGNIQSHLKNTLLDLVKRERNNEQPNRLALRGACKMLVQLGVGNPNNPMEVYIDDFEKPFLEQTTNFYRSESQQFLSENNASVYLVFVEERIKEEGERAKLCLDPTTEPKVKRVVELELITNHMKTVIEMENSGLVHMLTHDKTEDLRRLHKFLKRVEQDGGMKVLTEALSAYLRSQGKAIVVEQAGGVDASEQVAVASTSSAPMKSEVNPVAFMQALLDLKARFDTYLSGAFDGDSLVKKTINADFEYFMNLNNRSAEYLSLYIDDVLKNVARKTKDTEAEQMLDKAMVLFRFLQEKDLFERYYKQHLAKRLINGKTASDELEKIMVGKLKTECGCQFTAKLEGMFKDMANTEILNEKWKAYGERQINKLDIEVDTKVLTTGCWPTSQVQVPVQLPRNVQSVWDKYNQFYINLHTGRKLTLAPAMGGCEIMAYFYGKPGASNDNAAAADPESSEAMEQTSSSSTMLTVPRKHLLIVNTFQMVVMQLFNTKDKYTYEEMLHETSIPDRELKRTLQSLALGKATQRILCRRGNSREIEPTDQFSVNEFFYSKLHKVKVQALSAKADTEPERRETKAKLDEDRRYEIEAAIVRVMKARKSLNINNLISEVSTQLQSRFPPEPSSIKKRIETLIERDYLRRDEKDQRLFHYVA